MSIGSLIRRGVLFVVTVLILVLWVAPGVVAYPTPSRIPIRWELDFRPGDLRLYVDPATREAYWYFTYLVINDTGRDRYWAPRFTLFTDGGRIVNSGEGVPLSIERTIIDLLGNRFLERQSEAIGNILVGKENAIEGLVVWPADDMGVTEMTLFVSGISGETAEVTHPISGQKEVLAKTLKRDYLVPGDPLARGSDPLEAVGQTWVMR